MCVRGAALLVSLLAVMASWRLGWMFAALALAVLATVALAVRRCLAAALRVGGGGVIHGLDSGFEPAFFAPAADIALFTLLELLGDTVGDRAALASRRVHLTHLLQLRLQLLEALFLLDFGVGQGLDALTQPIHRLLSLLVVNHSHALG